MSHEKQEGGPSRRGFLTRLFMWSGLAVSYLTAFAYAVRFLYPVKKDRKRRLFVTLRSKLPPGSSMPFRTPEGQTINVVHGQRGLVALSDVCPHLGCRVHWDARENEFVCPCHDGHFDATGAPVSGPPAEMNAPLSRFDLLVEGEIIYLALPVKA